MMRSKYRSQAGIVYDILKTIKELGKAPPTRIMYGANLPYDRLRAILRHLVEQGLIKEIREENRVYYTLTKKGFRTLELLEETKRLLEELGLRF